MNTHTTLKFTSSKTNNLKKHKLENSNTQKCKQKRSRTVRKSKCAYTHTHQTTSSNTNHRIHSVHFIYG